MVQEIMENCPKCPRALKMEYKMPSITQESWFWLIKKVKNGPISDLICLIPKIRHFDLFGCLFEANCVTEFQQDYLILLKVSKSQKLFFSKLHCPKKERNISQNSALESRIG